MLCTPPAFILSQDQTLEIIVLKHQGLPRWSNLLSSLALSFFYFCLSSILILRISEIRFKLLFALYFSLVVQFSRIISPPLLRQLEYYTTFLRLCQYLSQKFFHLFSGFFKAEDLRQALLFGESLYILSQSLLFVNSFFQKNWVFSIFFKSNREKSVYLIFIDRF